MLGLGLARGLVVVEPAIVGLVPRYRPARRDGRLVRLLLPLLLLLVGVAVAVASSSVLLIRVSVTVLGRGAVALLGCSVGLLTSVARLRASMLLLVRIAVAGGRSSVASLLLRCSVLLAWIAVALLGRSVSLLRSAVA